MRVNSFVQEENTGTLPRVKQVVKPKDLFTRRVERGLSVRKRDACSSTFMTIRNRGKNVPQPLALGRKVGVQYFLLGLWCYLSKEGRGESLVTKYQYVGCISTVSSANVFEDFIIC